MAISMNNLTAEQLQACSGATIMNPASNDGIISVKQESNGFTIIQDNGDVYSFSTSTGNVSYAGNTQKGKAAGETDEEKGENKKTVSSANDKLKSDTASLSNEKTSIETDVEKTSKSFENVQTQIKDKVDENTKNAQQYATDFENSVREEIDANVQAFKKGKGDITPEQYLQAVAGSINSLQMSYNSQMNSVLQGSTDIESQFGKLSGYVSKFSELQTRGKSVEETLTKKANLTKNSSKQEQVESLKQNTINFLTYANIKTAPTTQSIDVATEKTQEINEARASYTNNWLTIKQLPLQATEAKNEAKDSGSSEVQKLKIQFEKEQTKAEEQKKLDQQKEEEQKQAA